MLTGKPFLQKHLHILKGVIIIKRILLSLLLILFLLLVSGCRNFWYELSPDFIKAGYYVAPIGKRSLGHPDGKMYDNIYTLKGLPQSDYLLRTEGSPWGSAESYGFLLMNKKVQEPIFLYDVKMIEISKDINEFNKSIPHVSEPVVIEDSQTIADFILLRTNGVGIDKENFFVDDDSYWYVYFYFDLPCKLVWKSSIFWDESKEQKIYWRVHDVASGSEICYDATEILSPLLS